MDKAARSPKETFRTRCSLLQLLCLLGGLLPFARVSYAAGSGKSVPGSPSLVVYRPKFVERSTQDGAFVISTGQEAVLLFYGENFTNETTLWLTNKVSCFEGEPGGELHSLGQLVSSEDGKQANITYPALNILGEYHFCLSDIEASKSAVLQGNGEDPTLKLVIADSGSSSESPLLPLPVVIVIILVLILLSGTFSGLNLGLMSLDPTTLKLVMESGSGRQKIYAKLIYRVRRYGNYLLCTLLLGNVLVNNTLAILLDSVLGSGLYAIIASTVAIVIFGEIIPQAICSRHALTIGAYTIWLTYIFMALTFPLSFPISLILHFILGKEIGAVYTRDELLGLLKVTEDHHGIGKDEVQMISGALKFKEKTAEDVMTKFEYVYCLDIQSVLDFRTIREMYDSGFSRIPVYEETKSNIVGVLYAKDLAFVDPDDEMPLKQVLNFYNRELTSVYNDTKLDELLEQFAGGQCHLALVNIVVQEGSGDPQLQVVGEYMLVLIRLVILLVCCYPCMMLCSCVCVCVCVHLKV
jgi:Mg2+/Co2+ transporter CorB